MNKPKIFLTIGVWILVLPYLGFPLTLKNILFNLTGFILIYLAYLMYRESNINKKENEKHFDSFSENKNFVKEEREEIEIIEIEKEEDILNSN